MLLLTAMLHLFLSQNITVHILFFIPLIYMDVRYQNAITLITRQAAADTETNTLTEQLVATTSAMIKLRRVQL